MTAFAEEGPAYVKYDNTNAIVDPTNPADPDYLIRIPGAINFTDENRSIKTPISMVTPDGDVYEGDKQALVKVESSNTTSYSLKSESGNDQIDYKLLYEKEDGELKTMADGNEFGTIGVLSSSRTSIDGKAVLGQDKAKLQEVYSDILYFVVNEYTPVEE
ncbi:hypothetical protein [Vagococcus xieshaowenii]|uniref:WxL domain-containing protein n=1 Tax=Vagococcus xieshaowenii TaxID=2562451 RepID=A0ABX5TBD2_9ENTE|nr:hypothetical protein [Vagococcus xieshaowenii]QCA27901.1 hypothetical protein E4Z98_00470 [Vagococcus xieshaowenii]